MPEPIFIAGFFPPPITGQGLATEHLAELLEGAYDVHRVNLRLGEEHLDLRIAGRLREKMSGYRFAGKRLAGVLRSNPEATVLWTAISPEPLGHFRDLISIVPAFQPSQKIYAVVHWGRFARLFTSPRTSLTAARLVRRLDGLVFLSEHLAEQCARWVPPEKTFVIANTLDRSVACTDDEIIQKQAGHDGRRPPRLLFLSHMIREKGYMDVLEALYLMRERGLIVEAIFAGQWLSDRDRQGFEHFVNRYRLGDIVRHLGPVTERSRVKALYLEADIFLLPSYLIEGQPLTIIEALNAGSPVIASNLGGTIDMLDQGREGYLIPPRSPAAIADAVHRLIPRDAWLAASEAARNRYLRDYDEAVIMEKWRDLLD